METLILSPSWVLTMNHAASSYGAPVLVNRDTGEAFGAGDVLGAYPGWSGLPAGTVVTRLAQASVCVL
jgi:hypothetical protein